MLSRRAAVVGSPIGHSLSPALHGAAYAALGLSGWTYGRSEVGRGELAAHVAGLGPEWVGLSVTMPGKEEALRLALEASEEALLAGAANTLVRRDDGWYAENTDVYGLATALREAGAAHPRHGVVLGGGATARSAVLALHRLGVTRLDLVVRDRVRPETAVLLERLDLDCVVRPLADGIPLGGEADVIVGTLPGSVPAPDLHDVGTGVPVVLDVTYAPWPSALARAVAGATDGRLRAVRGSGMLLHQAARQVELMTGRPAPVETMAAALRGEIAHGDGERHPESGQGQRR